MNNILNKIYVEKADQNTQVTEDIMAMEYEKECKGEA